MYDSVRYTFPAFNAECEEAFRTLCSMTGAIEDSQEPELFRIFPANQLKPITSFKLDSQVRRLHISFHEGDKKFELPESFFNNERNPGAATKGYKCTFAEAAQKLLGHVAILDHSGIIIPRQTVTETEWHNTVNEICQHSLFIEYPPNEVSYYSDGHRWLFVRPASAAEMDSGKFKWDMDHSPKWEIDWSHEAYFTILQFDMKTNLAREEIKDLYGDQIFGIPQLDSHFLSVWTRSPWGPIIRLDMRDVSQLELPTEGKLERGIHIRRDGPSTWLPRIPNG